MSTVQKILTEAQFISYSMEIITIFVVISIFNFSYLYQSLLCNKKL